MARGAWQITRGENIDIDLNNIDLDRHTAADITQDGRRWSHLIGSMYSDREMGGLPDDTTVPDEYVKLNMAASQHSKTLR